MCHTALELDEQCERDVSLLVLCVAKQLCVKTNHYESKFSCQAQLHFSVETCNNNQLADVNLLKILFVQLAHKYKLCYEIKASLRISYLCYNHLKYYRYKNVA